MTTELGTMVLELIKGDFDMLSPIRDNLKEQGRQTDYRLLDKYFYTLALECSTPEQVDDTTITLPEGTYTRGQLLTLPEGVNVQPIPGLTEHVIDYENLMVNISHKHRRAYRRFCTDAIHLFASEFMSTYEAVKRIDRSIRKEDQQQLGTDILKNFFS